MQEKGRYRLEDFELYKAARDFRRQIYELLPHLPSAEKYCLDQQLRRAAVSVTNNIAEGHGRWHYRENIQFCRMARGSLEEVIDDLTVFEDQHYGNTAVVSTLKEQAYQLIARINGYIGYLKKSQTQADGDPV